MVHSLGFRHSQDREAALKFMVTLQGRHMNVYGEFKPAEFTSEEILDFVQILCKYRYPLSSTFPRIFLAPISAKTGLYCP
jgi:hypothetical protein